MKLCWLVPNDRSLGVATVALACCRQAARAGHEVTLLSMRPWSGWIDAPAGVELASLEVTDVDRVAPALLQDWVTAHRPDVLFLNGCREVEPAIPCLPSGTRACFVIHDTAHWASQAAIRHERDLDAIVAVSRVVARRFTSRLHEPSHVHVIHNGAAFPAPEAAVSDGSRSGDLLFLGGSDPNKGAFDVLALWPGLLAAGFPGRLHWFGDLESKFAARVAALRGGERIVLHGRRPRAEVFAAAAQCSVLLMLSREEPFGMATVEAMGMGCVPVAWDVDTGTREIVESGRTGWLVPLGDRAAFIRRIVEAARNRDRLGAAAQVRARRDFSEAAMWARYAELLAGLATHPVIERTGRGRVAPDYEPTTRYLQLLPAPVRGRVRALVGRSPRLGFWLRNLRGR